MLKMTRQMSESYLLGGLLTLIGGFLDAYTYLSRGKVFANAQTGNVVLLGLHIADGDFKGALFYLMPVLTFAVGVLISSFIKDKFKGKSKLHWRQIVVAIEAAALLAVTFLKSNMAANILVSFVCALQAQTFRKVHGHALATTMCTGNLRIATETLYSAAKTKSRKLVSKCRQYYFIIVTFLAGAAIGTLITNRYMQKSCIFAFGGLVLAFLFMFIDTEKDKIKAEIKNEIEKAVEKEVEKEIEKELKKEAEKQ